MTSIEATQQRILTVVNAIVNERDGFQSAPAPNCKGQGRINFYVDARPQSIMRYDQAVLALRMQQNGSTAWTEIKRRCEITLQELIDWIVQLDETEVQHLPTVYLKTRPNGQPRLYTAARLANALSRDDYRGDGQMAALAHATAHDLANDNISLMRTADLLLSIHPDKPAVQVDGTRYRARLNDRDERHGPIIIDVDGPDPSADHFLLGD